MPPANPLLDATLYDGAPIITPSAAVSRQLRDAYDAAQRELGLRAWEPPPILTWSQWLDSLWTDAITSGADTRLLLNQAQEHAVWVDVIAASPYAADSALTSPDSLAELAVSAWNLAHAWQAVSRLRSFANTNDTQIFSSWAQDFHRICTKAGFLSATELESTLGDLINAGSLQLPPQIHLAGFADFTPAQTAFLDRLGAAETRICHRNLSTAEIGARTVLPAANEQEELASVAHWIRGFLTENPAARVGFLVPNLAAEQAGIDAVFRDVLAPELQSVAADLGSKPYEFSTGQPLKSFPIIAGALDLIRLTHGPLELDRVTALLLSPYLGNLKDRDAVAQFDAQILRKAKLLRPEITLAKLVELSKVSAYTDAISWSVELIQIPAKTPQLYKEKPFSDWADLFRKLVQTAGWPGARPLDSHEFQLTRAWDDALDSLATLDFRGQRVTFDAALRALERQVTTALFSPPSTGASVQILAPTAAVGLTFDALILARATEANFPPAERPNPLIGFGLQATLNMPGTSQALATERANRTLQCLLSTAPNIVISYATENADAAQRLSPMLAELGWPAIIATATPAALPLTEDVMEDNDPLPPLANRVVSGGARVLQSQAACGFRAFAEFRLRAVALDDTEIGFDPIENGNLLHRAVDRFWGRITTQDQLHNLPAQTRRELLISCIASAVDRRFAQENGWDEAYVSLQQTRLLRLLELWLELELKRGPFEVIGRETKQTLEIGPLDLELRLDRIDRVPDRFDPEKSGFFLIDYKTGSTGDPKAWEGPRPDEPQLPLYAMLHEHGELKGLAFARVRLGAKNMKWAGFQDEPGLIPGKETPEFHEQMEAWRAELTALAEDFARGDVSVSPKEYPRTCTHCAQRLLCRLDPAALLAGADPDDFEPTGDRDDG